MNDLTLDESLLIWKVALESGYIRSSVWVDWADNQILELDSPPFWVLEMSLIDTVEKATLLLCNYSRKIQQDTWNRIECANLYLGFLYLRFERGDLKLEDLLIQAGKFADRRNCKIDCSVFFLLFHEIDSGNYQITVLQKQVGELFEPMVELASSYLSKIPVIESYPVHIDRSIHQ
jgi:hypothetical protein